MPSDKRHFKKCALIKNAGGKSEKSNNRAALMPHIENINAVISLGEGKIQEMKTFIVRHPDFRNKKSGTAPNQRSTGSAVRPDLFPVQKKFIKIPNYLLSL